MNKQKITDRQCRLWDQTVAGNRVVSGHRVKHIPEITAGGLPMNGMASSSGKSGPKDQVALHYYYTSPSHWCTTHEVSKL